MSLLDIKKFHNVLQCDKQLAASVVGPSCSWNGGSEYVIANTGRASYIGKSGINNCIDSDSVIQFDNPLNVVMIGVWFNNYAWGYTEGKPSDGDFHTLFSIYVDDDNRISVSFNPDNGIEFEIEVKPFDSHKIYITDFDNSNADLWHRLIAVYDRAGIGETENRRRLYLDGVLIGSSDYNPPETSKTDFNLRIGAYNGAGVPAAISKAFNGYIKDVRVYHSTHITEEHISDALDNQDIGDDITNIFVRLEDNDETIKCKCNAFLNEAGDCYSSVCGACEDVGCEFLDRIPSDFKYETDDYIFFRYKYVNGAAIRLTDSELQTLLNDKEDIVLIEELIKDEQRACAIARLQAKGILDEYGNLIKGGG